MFSRSPNQTIVPPAPLAERADQRKLSSGYKNGLNKQRDRFAYAACSTASAVEVLAQIYAHANFRAAQTQAACNAIAHGSGRQAEQLSAEDVERLKVISQRFPDYIAAFVDRAAGEIGYQLDQALQDELDSTSSDGFFAGLFGR